MASEGLVAKPLSWAWPKWLRGLLTLGLAGLAFFLLVLGLGRTRSMLVIDVDGHQVRVFTHATTVAAALQQAGLEVFPGDWVSPGLDTPLEPGTTVRIERAQPVTLRADGRSMDLRTHAVTLGALLAEAGAQAGPGDEVWLDGKLAGLEEPLIGVARSSPAGAGLSRAGAGLQTVPQPPQIILRRATTLTLDDDGVNSTLHTTLTTVGQVLQAQGLTLYLADRITPGLEERVQSGMTVTIQRSLPVEIQVDGRTLRTRTLAKTVAGVLGQEGIALVGQDSVEPGLDAPIQSSIVHVTRVREESIVEFEAIPFRTVWAADPELEIDNRRLAQAGQPGLTKRRYHVRYENGQEVERKLEDSWTEQQPVTKTLAYGIKIVVRTLDTPDGPIEYWRKMRVYTTSYTAASSGKSPDHPRFGYTRLGWKLTKGIVAVDPDVIPLKSKLYVPGYGFARAGDTGGGVKGKFVDLGFDSWNYRSWHWWTDVYLLTPVPPRSEIRWVLPDRPRYPDRRR